MSCVELFVFVLIAIHHAVSWEMHMTPEYAILRHGDVIDIICKSDVALAACGFQIGWDNYTDLSTDQQVSRYSNGKKFSYTALEYGQEARRQGRCGIRFTAGQEINVQNVGCRGRTSTGQWKYDALTLLVQDKTGFPMSISPRHPPFVQLGQELTVLCKSDRPMEYCTVQHQPSKPNYQTFLRGQSTASQSSLYQFAGAGLEKGECGIKILQVTEKDAGWVVCSASAGGQTLSHRATIIRVAKPPSGSPDLIIPHDTLTAGDLLTAECMVSASRPPANITWYLGHTILEGTEVPVREFQWPDHLQGRKQTVTWKVTSQDDGKMLKCVITHVALSTHLEAKKKINVARVPVPTDTTSTWTTNAEWTNELTTPHPPASEAGAKWTEELSTENPNTSTSTEGKKGPPKKYRKP